jgi:hypothetical protein
MGRTSCWRDVKNLTLLYLASGASFVPWGVIYALVALRGGESFAVATVLLAGGALTAMFVWNRLERAQKSRERARDMAMLAHVVEARFWFLTEEYPVSPPIAAARVRVIDASPGKMAVARGRVLEVAAMARPGARANRGWTFVRQN